MKVLGNSLTDWGMSRRSPIGVGDDEFWGGACTLAFRPRIGVRGDVPAPERRRWGAFGVCHDEVTCGSMPRTWVPACAGKTEVRFTNGVWDDSG